MKISYKNTALALLENPDRFPFYLPEEDTKNMNEEKRQEFGRSIRVAFRKGSKGLFDQSIQYITQPFYRAYQAARNKLRDLYDKQQFEESGTLIIPWPRHTQTIFYFIKTSGSGENWKIQASVTMFTKSPRSDQFGLDLHFYLNDFTQEVQEFCWTGFIKEHRTPTWWIADIILIKTFLRFADLETKIVNAQRRERHCGEKYVNETDRKIEILDSTYFTTISRTEGFGVSGHFRLQPYGPGRDQRRLQWISDYQKQGYTRKAKMLNQ